LHRRFRFKFNPVQCHSAEIFLLIKHKSESQKDSSGMTFLLWTMENFFIIISLEFVFQFILKEPS